MAFVMGQYLEIINDALMAGYSAVRQSRHSALHRKIGRGSYGDLTYGIDKIAENAVLGRINKCLPNARVVSEEAGILGSPTAQTNVLLDPIDGSTNAFRAVPFYSTALAIADGPRFSDIKAAGVINICNGQMIMAEEGRGTWAGKTKAIPSKVKDWERAYICVDMNFKSFSPEEIAVTSRLLEKLDHPRSLGSAALETAMISTGSIDAFVEVAPRLRAFDCMPSLFLVREAGGFLQRLGGVMDDYLLDSRERLAYVAAATNNLGEKIMGLLEI
jgi:myo-inositol-1(or 4)-monophosphatase|tara:strand:- start:917 stop:1735 length:819 start_codon:yes stop_codon:yes gene_type:complete